MVTIRPTAEVTIKAPRTRDMFMRKLRLATKDALQRVGFSTRVRVRANRVMALIEPKEGFAISADEARVALARVFGVGSFSFLEATCTADLEDIVATGTQLFSEAVKGKRYAVRCKRGGRHAFSSMDVERKLGAAINAGAKVDLTNPEITVEVEVDDKRAHFFSQRHPGPGGLPMGTGGHALALLSGGYDSIVAAWQLMRRGVEVDFVHFRLGEYQSETIGLQVAKVLSDAWGAGSRPEAHVIDLRAAMDEMRDNVTQNLWQVSLKRLMLRAAEGVADALEQRGVLAAQDTNTDPRDVARMRARRRIDALITGEAIGQVSSQTLSNLRAIDEAARRPVLRPLIGFDKLEIIAVAERIGTAALSAKAVEECNITPVRPATSSRADRLTREESGMEISALEAELDRVRSGHTRLPLRSLKAGEGVLPEGPALASHPDFGPLHVTSLLPGTVLLDCRSEHTRRWRPDWPAVESVAQGVISGNDFDKNTVYVAFCPINLRSNAVAEKLREGGIRAYSFGGGDAALKAYLDSLVAGAS